MTAPRRILAAFWTAAALTAPAAAQTSTATLSANIGTVARLTLSTASVSFPDADPDVTPQIPASGGPVLVTAKARATPGAQVLLTIQASRNLRSGLDTVNASNVTWTATGAGFVAGTLSRPTAVPAGSWTGSGIRSGAITFYFRNRWSYATGIYSTTMTFTLTAP